MEFIKIITACLLLVVVHARHHNSFADELVKELVEDIIEKQEEKALFQDPTVIDKSNVNLKMCWAANINCEHCSQCGPNKSGGWCVKDLVDQPGPQCICNYGWTGKNAKYIPDTDTSYHSTGWGRNRLRADRCDVPCHYTYDVKNSTCVDFCFLNPTDPTCTKPPNKGCDPKCGQFNGVCTKMSATEERCLCCRGWAGPNKSWSSKHGRYWADYCPTECQWLNGPNDQCKKRPDVVKPCNAKCTVENNGKCLPSGRCECCRDWTGPNAEHNGVNGKIQADYCDVYCPFTKDTHRHDLCVRDDYIKRRRAAGHKIDV